MTLLIINSTGKIGKRVAQRLDGQAISFRGVSRSTPIPFDWQDMAIWPAALKDTTAAFVSFVPDLAAPGALAIMEHFVAAAREAGLRKLMLLTGRGEIGAVAAENVVRESSLDWAIVRAAWFNQNFSEGHLLDSVLEGTLYMPAGDRKEAFVDAEDIADVATAALLSDRHNGQIYEVTGPDLLSFGEVATQIAAAANHPYRYHPVLLDEFHAGLMQSLPRPVLRTECRQDARAATLLMKGFANPMLAETAGSLSAKLTRCGSSVACPLELESERHCCARFWGELTRERKWDDRRSVSESRVTARGPPNSMMPDDQQATRKVCPMTANPQTKYVVVHQDDVGMNHGANSAFVELSHKRICTAGSVMVPCPWFPEIAALARQNPELDIGVHLTLNSDMGPYKWRPLTGVSGNGLTGPDGYFWQDVPSVRRYANSNAVAAELRAQVEAALNAGIDVTHLDCHMGTAMMPEFVDIYEQLGVEFNLPLLLMRDFRTFSVMSYVGPVTTDEFNGARDRAASRGNPIVDLQLETIWDWPNGIEAAYRQLFSSVPDGVSWLALHFNAPGEVELFDAEAHIRVGEYEFFRSGQASALMEEYDLVPTGVKHWRDTMRR